jgi:hypothetical protein
MAKYPHPFEEDYTVYDQCANATAWSILQSASPNSQLAGVLAGFQIAVIAFLFAKPKRINAHAIGLFASGVFILGLDSYLFSLLTGMDLHSKSRPNICSIVWAQGMAASGMSAVGGTVLVSGLGWMLISYGEDLVQGLEAPRNSSDKAQAGTPEKRKSDIRHRMNTRRAYFSTFNGWLASGIIVTTTLLLTFTTNYYLTATSHRTSWLVWAVWSDGILICLISIIGVSVRTVVMVDYVHPGRSITAVDTTLVVKTAHWIASRSGYQEPERTADFEPSLGRLPQTTYWVALLAILGTLFAGALTQWSLYCWVRTVGSVALGLVIPGLIAIGITFSVATPKSKADKWELAGLLTPLRWFP